MHARRGWPYPQQACRPFPVHTMRWLPSLHHAWPALSTPCIACPLHFIPICSQGRHLLPHHRQEALAAAGGCAALPPAVRVPGGFRCAHFALVSFAGCSACCALLSGVPFSRLSLPCVYPVDSGGRCSCCIFLPERGGFSLDCFGAGCLPLAKLGVVKLGCVCLCVHAHPPHLPGLSAVSWCQPGAPG